MDFQQYPGMVQYFLDHKSEFFWQVYFPIMLWLVLVLIFLILLFIRYTFGNWSPENPNPYEGETFGMPRGTFRGILTMTLLFVVVILELVNVRVVGFEQEIHELMIAFQMMIAFYFGAKVMHHITAADKKKALAQAGFNPENPNVYVPPVPPSYHESEQVIEEETTTTTGAVG